MSVTKSINVLCQEQHFITFSAHAFFDYFSPDKITSGHSCYFQLVTHALMHTFTEGTTVKSQTTLEEQLHRYKQTLPFPQMLHRVRTERLPEDSSAVLLFCLQTISILLLSQLPPAQVSGTLQTVHSGSEEVDEVAWHQLGGQPTLWGKTHSKWGARINNQLSFK